MILKNSPGGRTEIENLKIPAWSADLKFGVSLHSNINGSFVKDFFADVYKIACEQNYRTKCPEDAQFGLI